MKLLLKQVKILMNLLNVLINMIILYNDDQLMESFIEMNENII